MAKQKLKDSKYHNWLRAGLALFFTKQGIQTFVKDEIEEFQQKCLKDGKGNLLKSCSSCQTESIVPCNFKNGICKEKNRKCTFHRKIKPSGCPSCKRFHDQLIQFHRYKGPSFRNTNAGKWSTNPWELAKCFMPPDGYAHVSDVDDTDFNGVVSVILNYKGFDMKIQEDLSQSQNIFEKARRIGKLIRHSSNLEVEDSDLSEYLATLKSLLSDTKYIVSDVNAKAAMKELIQLENDDWTIESKDLQCVLDDAATTIIQQRLKEVHNELQKEAEEQNLKLIRNTLDAIKREERISVAVLKELLAECLNQIRNETEKSKDEIREDVNKGKIEIDEKVKEGLQVIEKRGIDLKKEFKDDLVEFNKTQYGSIPLSPLYEEVATSLTDFYVMPDMFATNERKRTRIKSLRDIFFLHNKRFTEIYITADAGFGKTAFSKKLVMTWCEAQQVANVSNENIRTMTEFDFLFFVSLRNTEDKCNIDDMIMNQVLINMSKPSSYTRKFLEEILSKEKCLVILDGLDEWMHSLTTQCPKTEKEVPHRNVRPNTTVLTTTRPWKLSVLDLKNTQVHNTVEIKGLTEKSIRQLTHNAISKMSDLYPSSAGAAVALKVKNFEEAVEETAVKTLQEIPLLLLYMICLWYDKIDFGRSMSEFYVRVIEFLLTRSKSLGISDHTPDAAIPVCFKQQEKCKGHLKMLLDVSELAFHTLFSRESTLVFDSNTAEKYLKSYFDNTLKSGILTQSKEQTLAVRKKKVSFAHKSIQEFFAALFIFTKKDDIVELVRPVCKNIDDILGMNLVYSFLSGMSLKFSKSLFEMLKEVVAGDKRTQDYRKSSLIWDRSITQALQEIQNMFVKILKESIDVDNEACILRLDDFFIGLEWESTKYTDLLQKLLSVNKLTMKTISIKSNENITNFGEVLEKFKLHETKSLEKIFYRNDTIGEEVNVLLKGSTDTLRYLTLNCHKWDNDVTCDWPEALSRQIGMLNNLQGIAIDGFVIQHRLLEKLLDFLKNESSLLEISLYNLKCADSKHDTDGCCKLDLSSNNSIKVLRLNSIPLKDMNINVCSLESCDIGKLKTVATILEDLEKADKLKTLLCSFQESKQDINNILLKLSSFGNLRFIQLRKMNVDDKVLKPPPEIERIKLWKVTISSQSLQNMSMDLEKLNQPVRVEIDECTVQPQFEDFKEFIRNHPSLFILNSLDEKCSEDSFAFTTKGKDRSVSQN